MLGVATSTLRHQIRNGKLAARKLGRDWVVDSDEVERYGEAHRRRPGPEPAPPAARSLAADLIRASSDLARAADLALAGNVAEAVDAAERQIRRLSEALTVMRSSKD
jgi:transposase